MYKLQKQKGIKLTMKKQEKRTKGIIIQTIKTNIQNNKKQYLVVAIIFLIGLIVGVTFLNNIDTASNENTSKYILNFIEALKTDYQIDKISLLKSSIINYLIIAIIIWFMGSTVVGIPIVYLIVAFKGFSLGYTISCILITLGTGKGILFSIASLFFQNIIIIPCILAIAVSGIKLYSSIMKDRRRENIKIEILRHTMFSLFITTMFVVASFIEVYISSNLLSICVKFL